MSKNIEIENHCGMRVVFSHVGASIRDIFITTADGATRSVTVDPRDDRVFDRSQGYYGKTIGRNAGRIARGDFAIDGEPYHIVAPRKSNGLHGGDEGLSHQVFSSQMQKTADGQSVRFSYVSPHLEGGFPGNLRIAVTYLLSDDRNRLEIKYHATSDRDTMCNLTNHTYFNLEGRGPITNHHLRIRAQRYAEVDASLLPTSIEPVDQVMDFTHGKPVINNLRDPRLQEVAGGYDHPFILDERPVDIPAASLHSEGGDVQLNIYTTYPVLVFYSGNHPLDEMMNHGQKAYKYDALALEAQYLPNAINDPLGQKKTGLLRSGETYDETIIYEFIVDQRRRFDKT